MLQSIVLTAIIVVGLPCYLFGVGELTRLVVDGLHRGLAIARWPARARWVCRGLLACGLVVGGWFVFGLYLNGSLMQAIIEMYQTEMYQTRQTPGSSLVLVATTCFWLGTMFGTVGALFVGMVYGLEPHLEGESEVGSTRRGDL